MLMRIITHLLLLWREIGFIFWELKNDKDMIKVVIDLRFDEFYGEYDQLFVKYFICDDIEL